MACLSSCWCAACCWRRQQAQFSQQGPKLVGTDAVGGVSQGFSVALSGNGNDCFLPQEQVFQTRERVNNEAASRRMLAHFTFTAGWSGWLDQAVERFKPNYGSPRSMAISASCSPGVRLDP